MTDMINAEVKKEHRTERKCKEKEEKRGEKKEDMRKGQRAKLVGNQL